jgi:hypothetical protein
MSLELQQDQLFAFKLLFAGLLLFFLDSLLKYFLFSIVNRSRKCLVADKQRKLSMIFDENNDVYVWLERE